MEKKCVEAVGLCSSKDIDAQENKVYGLSIMVSIKLYRFCAQSLQDKIMLLKKARLHFIDISSFFPNSGMVSLCTQYSKHIPPEEESVYEVTRQFEFVVRITRK